MELVWLACSCSLGLVGAVGVNKEVLAVHSYIALAIDGCNKLVGAGIRSGAGCGSGDAGVLPVILLLKACPARASPDHTP